MKKEKVLKSLVALIGVVIFSVSLYIIMNNTIGSYGANSQGDIYDDDSKIVSEGDSYSYVTSVGNNKGGTLKLHFRFTGMHTVYNIMANQNEKVEVDYDARISSGEFKIVFINPQNKITNVFEGTGKGNKQINLDKGKTRVKIVAKDARGDLRFHMTSKDDVNIKYVGEVHK